MTFAKVISSCSFVVLLFTACTKEPVIETLPLTDFKVHDLVPVRAVEIPSTGGMALLCKRSIDDPVLARAVVLDAQGELVSQLEFGGLPSTVENITFGPETWSITDLVPQMDGTFLLLGIGRQTDLADRLHLLVHHVDANGSPLSTPIRRYVTDQSVLVRADDLDQLYRTTALGAIRSTDRLAVTVRYDRGEEAFYRNYQIGLTGDAGSYSSAPVELASTDHLLHNVMADGEGGTYILLDTTNPSGPDTYLLVNHITWGVQNITEVESSILPLRAAVPLSVQRAGNELVIAGNYQTEADVRRPFFCRSTSIQGLDDGTVFPDIGGGDRSASIAAIVAEPSGFTAVCTVYEQRVLSLRALRDDRFCDLTTATLSPNGDLLDTRPIITGKGLRALGAWSQGEQLIGAFHPFLNTEYMHGFVLETAAY
ncbi:MAG: hypothetical protein IPN30_16155 [Flavobacteriales bacterium]|nr:hypothetical protein [Flavobacteriales bacterium]